MNWLAWKDRRKKARIEPTPQVSGSTIKLLQLQIDNGKALPESERRGLGIDILGRLLSIAVNPSQLDAILQDLAVHIGFIMNHAEEKEREIILTTQMQELAGQVNPRLAGTLASLYATNCNDQKTDKFFLLVSQYRPFIIQR